MKGQDSNASDIIEWLCTGSDNKQTSPKAEDILRDNFQVNSYTREEHVIHIEREHLWKGGLTFYKQCIAQPEKLGKNLVVDFVGEEGVDCGAIRSEFFTALLKEMNRRLFEGQTFRRIPKKSWGSNHIIAGMIIGHSLIQGGPSFAALSPSVYQFLTTGSEDKVMQSSDLETLPRSEDIPKDSSTVTLHELIEKVLFWHSI